ncbi:MAG: hypothetical protein NVSMB56_19000 [Pyrinomonadaceae bacterium]
MAKQKLPLDPNEVTPPKHTRKLGHPHHRAIPIGELRARLSDPSVTREELVTLLMKGANVGRFKIFDCLTSTAKAAVGVAASSLELDDTWPPWPPGGIIPAMSVAKIAAKKSAKKSAKKAATKTAKKSSKKAAKKSR